MSVNIQDLACVSRNPFLHYSKCPFVYLSNLCIINKLCNSMLRIKTGILYYIVLWLYLLELGQLSVFAKRTCIVTIHPLALRFPIILWYIYTPFSAIDNAQYPFQSFEFHTIILWLINWQYSDSIIQIDKLWQKILFCAIGIK